MTDEEIKIGDRLRIREWDDMAAEFGVDDCGNIAPRIEYMNGGLPVTSHEIFTKDMLELCGLTFTVEHINTYGSYINDYRAEEHEFDHFMFEAWMFEPISDEVLKPEEPDGLFGFLLS